MTYWAYSRCNYFMAVATLHFPCVCIKNEFALLCLWLSACITVVNVLLQFLCRSWHTCYDGFLVWPEGMVNKGRKSRTCPAHRVVHPFMSYIFPFRSSYCKGGGQVYGSSGQIGEWQFRKRLLGRAARAACQNGCRNILGMGQTEMEAASFALELLNRRVWTVGHGRNHYASLCQKSVVLFVLSVPRS